MACIRKRELTDSKGKPYLRYVVDYKDQNGIRRTPQFEKKKEADAFLDKVKRELFEGVHVAQSEAITFDKLADLYLKDCERRRRIGDAMSGNTLDLIGRLVRVHLVPAFGSDKVTDITGAKVRAFVNEKAERYSRVTVEKLITLLRDALQFGVREGYLRRNIIRDEPPRNPLPPRGQIEVPTLDHLRAIVAAVEAPLLDPKAHPPGLGRRKKNNGSRITAITVYLALTCGLRRGEICGLRWENVDFGSEVINVRHSISRRDGLKGPKSKAGLRRTPMVAVLRRHLLAMWELQERPAEGFVLTTSKGTPFGPDDLSAWHWEPVARAAEVRRADGSLMGLHSIRHAAVSLWIKAGLSDLALKEVVGHSSVNTTKDVYGHLYDADDEARHAMRNSLAVLRLSDEMAALPMQQAAN
ncbi:tyrosine-type recombinase/integrase [Methylobacterium dankookense]|uniref:Tyrosine recombinase XerC n=1 Tax=Methylobacterium dankookense TaxID=560405 RepID=A0A564G7W4_9HYPH|nr:site-specific integrase [Methylobacterium dankookense]GJD58364.1 Tyrosine recombinase XerC [Methylobacterium dankookense]VUF15631.1 Tyrosine recombinase XerC [Methylobacterium dankookense]